MRGPARGASSSCSRWRAHTGGRQHAPQRRRQSSRPALGTPRRRSSSSRGRPPSRPAGPRWRSEHNRAGARRHRAQLRQRAQHLQRAGPGSYGLAALPSGGRNGAAPRQCACRRPVRRAAIACTRCSEKFSAGPSVAFVGVRGCFAGPR